MTSVPPIRSAKGTAKAQEFIDAAGTLFGRTGFKGTSLRDIARATGISHQNLLYYFPTKDDLLMAVLRQKDQAAFSASAGAQTWDQLHESTRRTAEANRENPGLIALFAVTSAEATDPAHPAHNYFRERYRRGVELMTGVFSSAVNDGRSVSDLDPQEEARKLFALQDGLQIQWLLEPDLVDIPGIVSRHLAQLVAVTDDPGSVTPVPVPLPGDGYDAESAPRRAGQDDDGTRADDAEQVPTTRDVTAGQH